MNYLISNLEEAADDARPLQSCGACKFYDPLKGEPPAGWCQFIASIDLPFWSGPISTKGSDVTPADGAECRAFIQEKD